MLGQIASARQLSKPQFLDLSELFAAQPNRAPDAVGLLYWANELTERARHCQKTAPFFEQNETRARSPNPSDTDNFVSSVHLNLLNRRPDSSGFAFWTSAFDTGLVTAAFFVLRIILGVKVSTGTADEADRAGKTALGLYFAAVQGSQTRRTLLS